MPEDIKQHEAVLHVKFFMAALTGLLADPEDRDDERTMVVVPDGSESRMETCRECVVRLAWEHADEAIVQYRRRYGL